MTRALVLMKAMPPTKGHERLINFARGFAASGLVLMDCAPDEPMIQERKNWLNHFVPTVDGWYSWALDMNDQNSESDGFWERWKGYINDFALLRPFDFVIGSEPYCAKLADVIGAQWIPYDPERQLDSSRATDVRKFPTLFFDEISPSFRQHMQTTVTVFGAESTGKTTLSYGLSRYYYNGYAEWVFEWARPYLEATGRTVCDLQDMHNIWHGQYAVEESAKRVLDKKAFIFRDTDLYSTIGYWEQPHWIDTYGPVPEGLIADAAYHKADLYIITSSDIPFEKDPLRYGGDHRESPDSYWIGVAEKYDLNYVVLTERDKNARLNSAAYLAGRELKRKNAKLMEYQRELVSK